AAPLPAPPPGPPVRVAPPGQIRQALAPRPLAALRLDEQAVPGLARLGLRPVGDTPGVPRAGAPPRVGAPVGSRRGRAHGGARVPLGAVGLAEEAVAGLARLGLRHVGDSPGVPRAGLSRRFGAQVVRRLDQALGVEVEPVPPARPPLHFAVRLTLPDPIGLAEDILAAIDRLLPALCDRLRARAQGARRIRLQLFRADHSMQEIAVGLARAVDAAAEVRPLILLKLAEIDPGFGIDMIRIEAPVTEPLHPR